MRKWQKREGGTASADTFSLEQILGHLAQLEESQGHGPQAIDYWEQVKKISPVPASGSSASTCSPRNSPPKPPIAAVSNSALKHSQHSWPRSAAAQPKHPLRQQVPWQRARRRVRDDV